MGIVLILKNKTKEKTKTTTMKVSKHNLKAGFSLVEMLVVIAVIGIIAAIAVPNIGNINASAQDAKDRRNAQNLASVYASAEAAGFDNWTDETAVANIVGDLVGGAVQITDTSSPFNGTVFSVPGLTANDQTGAAQYLTIANGMMQYTGSAN